MMALRTSVNSPSVRICSGQVRMARMGRTMAFRIPKTSATSSRLSQPPLKAISPGRYSPSTLIATQRATALISRRNRKRIDPLLADGLFYEYLDVLVVVLVVHFHDLALYALFDRRMDGAQIHPGHLGRQAGAHLEPHVQQPNGDSHVHLVPAAGPVRDPYAQPACPGRLRRALIGSGLQRRQ